jgi:prolipoprotein diacylglyceryl transferase
VPILPILTIPSPSSGVWDLGPLPLRGYALCIIAGIIVAIVLGERRWQARGGRPGEVQDLAVWAVPFGVVGARLYHVATDWKKYFGEGGDPVQALFVWKGGLGIWGAVALGALGVWIWSRRKGIRIAPMLDVLAPGVIVAQAIGRWGNWFNQELYGKPTDLTWGLEIDQANWQCLVDGQQTNGSSCGTASGGPYADGTVFHPTYLYEFFWNLGVFGLLLWAERRFKLGFGRVFALYVMGYTLGRGWIEYLRVDNVQLEDVLGLRFNVWTSIVLFVAAFIYFVVSSRRHPGREQSVYRDGFGPAADEAAAAGTAGTAGGTQVDSDSDSDGDHERRTARVVDDQDDAGSGPVSASTDPSR